MFCYKCGAPNNESVKFCRGCGANLETVTLAVSGKLASPKGDSEKKNDKPATTGDWIAERAKGVTNIVQGATYAGGSLLVPLAAYLLLRDKVWVLISMLSVGWIFFWGLGSLAKGIGAVFESNALLRGADARAQTFSSDSQPALPAAAVESGSTTDDPDATAAPSPPSVTESTTKLLHEQPR